MIIPDSHIKGFPLVLAFINSLKNVFDIVRNIHKRFDDVATKKLTGKDYLNIVFLKGISINLERDSTTPSFANVAIPTKQLFVSRKTGPPEFPDQF